MNEKIISKKNRVEMGVFLAVSFGTGIIFGILIHFKIYSDISMISKYMMLTPAAGVAIGKMASSKQEKTIRSFYLVLIITLAAATCIMLVGILGDVKDTVLTIALVGVLVISSLILLSHGWESCPELDLGRNGRKGAKYLLLYTVVSTIAISVMQRGNLDYSKLFFSLLVLVPSFLFQGALFLGEELGWRGYLQPFLQKRIGKRMGVIATGIIWELWHIPFFYAGKWDWRITAIRFILVMALSIFLGYVYMKTQNIWIPAMIHCAHNTIFSFMSVDITRFVVGNIILSCIWGMFLFTSEYHREAGEKHTIFRN
ncbi:CPBP family intramembrane metalloprotease [Faecalicatena sp. AGMB00832]|uniref:CPBP family intramembrane metalloprotease n=1 Tax=Faecalicatena faecalis TaxID=2726362 RepID=A0ABS6D145_9FIRM|nr:MULTISPECIES: CPBP family intramembrane glutamic endopeptidase [Faecalicatena]MBU3875298.1 CPBP family intramembrane metalloprotease [Faecalicatena faecalis]MCI6467934.1 CPBP family intramembrane metalloprotease [Faecalicatena sp.]MDY5619424.1 CPBP family intramembrane glutamic endopeptidase [Lachnospiraceae bacterium]